MKEELKNELLKIKSGLKATPKDIALKELIDNTIIAIDKEENELALGFIAYVFHSQYYYIASQPIPPYKRGGIVSGNSEAKIYYEPEQLVEEIK